MTANVPAIILGIKMLLPDTRSSTTHQFFIQLGEGPQFVIKQHRHLAGQRLLECKAQSSDRCLSDNMFGLIAGSDD